MEAKIVVCTRPEAWEATAEHIARALEYAKPELESWAKRNVSKDITVTIEADPKGQDDFVEAPGMGMNDLMKLAGALDVIGERYLIWLAATASE